MRPFLPLVAGFAGLLSFSTAMAEPVAPASAAPASAAPASEAPVAEYTVRILPGEAKAGQPGQSVVEVTPAPGFKMNTEFPSRVKGLACSDGTLAKPELGPEDAEVTDKVLRFNVPFTAVKAGKVELNGLADFSVCNERTCKLIRDEKLAWAVDVK